MELVGEIAETQAGNVTPGEYETHADVVRRISRNLLFAAGMELG